MAVIFFERDLAASRSSSSSTGVPTFSISAKFNEEARSPFVKKYKTIVHPGEFSQPASSKDATQRDGKKGTGNGKQD